MSRNTILKTALAACAVILTFTVVLSIKTIIGFAGISFDNAEKYTAGDAVISSPVKNLDVDWTSGTVNIAYHKDNTILIAETSKKEISPDRQMRWWLDGNTLRIRYEKPGLHLFSITTQEKELTVTLPEGLALESVKIDATSGLLNIPSLTADDLKLDVTSGGIFAQAEAGKISAEATSGEIDLEIVSAAETITASATSGEIRIKAADADKVHLDTTSGNIRITAKNIGEFSAGSTSGSIQAEIGEAKNAKIDSTSGDLQMKISKIENLKAETTSGDVTAALPQEPGFTAHLDTTSGGIEYDTALTKQDRAYVCGDGSAAVEIETTSGDIHLLRAE